MRFLRTTPGTFADDVGTFLALAALGVLAYTFLAL